MRVSPIALLAVMGGCSRGATPDIAPIALTPTEYNNTVRDLLGMPDDPNAWPEAPDVAARVSPATGAVVNAFSGAVDDAPWPWPLPAEIGVAGFEGMADGQAPSAYQIEQLQLAATHFGAYALVAPDFFVCEGWESMSEPAARDCAWNSLERFTQRAWRRPLTGAERSRLRAFWDANVASGALDEAIALTAAGVLQAPQFLYRIELGDPTRRESGRVRLTDWELASRLSYLLWDSLPDEALFEAADQGRLSTPGGIRDEVERMLRDPRARTAVVRFHTQWLDLEALPRISPSQAAYGPVFGLPSQPSGDTADDADWPQALGPLRISMEGELHYFVSKTIFDGEGTLEALLTDRHGFLSDATEVVYGDGAEPREGSNERWSGAFVAGSVQVETTLTLRAVTFPPEERAGLLTLPAVLAVGAHPVHPSPVLRGKRILERVTCTEIGTPPPSAEAARPPDTVDAAATNRERTAQATSPDPCMMCHEVLNPPGFAFEHYDAIGRYRTQDNGQPVDASGRLELGGQVLRFRDGVELAHLLATHETVQDCYAQRWTDAALGYAADPSDPDVERILKEFRKRDDVLGLLEAIATSEMFRYRTVGEGR